MFDEVLDKPFDDKEGLLLDWLVSTLGGLWATNGGAVLSRRAIDERIGHGPSSRWYTGLRKLLAPRFRHIHRGSESTSHISQEFRHGDRKLGIGMAWSILLSMPAMSLLSDF